MIKLLTLLLTFAFALVYGQSTTAASESSALSTTSSASLSGSGNSSYPTKTIFLPLSNLGNIAASIVTAAPDSTVYGLACLHVTPSSCPYDASVTLTEGPSTLIYTMSYTGSDGATTKAPATVNCTISGTTAAVCQGATSLSGLGEVASTTTLAGVQLSFVPVSVTAGAERLSNVATQTMGASGTAPSSTSSGAGVAPTAMSWLAGAVGLAAIGAL